jgi:hypothetical protein
VSGRRPCRVAGGLLDTPHPPPLAAPCRPSPPALAGSLTVAGADRWRRRDAHAPHPAARRALGGVVVAVPRSHACAVPTGMRSRRSAWSWTTAVPLCGSKDADGEGRCEPLHRHRPPVRRSHSSRHRPCRGWLPGFPSSPPGVRLARHRHCTKQAGVLASIRGCHQGVSPRAMSGIDTSTPHPFLKRPHTISPFGQARNEALPSQTAQDCLGCVEVPTRPVSRVGVAITQGR